MRFIENLCWLEIKFLQRIHKARNIMSGNEHTVFY